VREARAAAGLNHDHVVPVFSVVNPPDAPPYLVMPFVAGPTLRERIHAENGLAPREAARICAQVADGLAAAHAAGLIHRDIKPANIILDKEHQRARIMDFGLVRVKEQTGGTTQEGTIPGTPEYMSPEQVRTPSRIDERSDVYSLGVTLYEALTAAVPFRGASHMVLQQVLHDEPLPPRRLSDRIPRDLETICLKAMAKERLHRYASAAELRDDLHRWLAGEPIQARPVGRVEKAWRWCRRRPREAALSAVVVGLMLLAVAGGVWYQQERAGRDAERALKRAEVEGDVAAAVREAAALRQRLDTRRDDAGRMQLLLEASSALQRAEGALAASKGLAPTELAAQVDAERRRLDQALKGQRFLAELQEIRAWRGDEVTGGNQDFPGADRRYIAAFKAYGLDVDGEAAPQIAARLHADNAHVRESLGVALDDWAYMRRQTKGNVRPLTEIAQLIDPDPLRNRIRAAEEKDTEPGLEELQALARAPESLDMPAPTAHLLALALFYRSDNAGAAALLRAAQRRHADDFQINHDLAWLHLYRLQPPQADEAIRFFSIALAARPQSAAASLGLANAFREKQDFAEAAAILAELVRKQPGNVHARASLGHLLGEQGRYAEAAVAFAKVVELQPDDSYSWYAQAAAHAGAGELAAHRKVCAAMVERFGNTKDAWVAGRILYAWVPGAEAVADAERLQALVDMVQADPNGGSRIQGAVLYRSRQYAQALTHLAKASQGRAWDCFFLAMAHHRLGQSAEALECYDKARAWMSAVRPHWTERAEGAALLREAETLVRAAAIK
jgi:serine/threonine-protein kinase